MSPVPPAARSSPTSCGSAIAAGPCSSMRSEPRARRLVASSVTLSRRNQVRLALARGPAIRPGSQMKIGSRGAPRSLAAAMAATRAGWSARRRSRRNQRITGGCDISLRSSHYIRTCLELSIKIGRPRPRRVPAVRVALRATGLSALGVGSRSSCRSKQACRWLGGRGPWSPCRNPSRLLGATRVVREVRVGRRSRRRCKSCHRCSRRSRHPLNHPRAAPYGHCGMVCSALAL